MDSIEKTLFSNNLQIFPYLFPQLTQEKLYLSIEVEKKKKEIVFEVGNLNLIYDQASFVQENIIENRFWLYEIAQNSAEKTYSYSFKRIDLSADAFVFDSKKTKLNSLNFLIHIYNIRKSVLENLKQSILVKSRLLSLNKKSYLVSCFGKQAFLSKNSIFNKTKKPKKNLYSSWVISNLKILGFLNSFRLKKWELKKVNYTKRAFLTSFLKKYKFYYKKNSSLKSYITLEKNKLLYD